MFMSIVAYCAIVQAIVCVMMYAFLFIKVTSLSKENALWFFQNSSWDILRPPYLYHASQIFTKNLLFYLFFITLFYWMGHKVAMMASMSNMIVTNLFYSFMLKKYGEVSE